MVWSGRLHPTRLVLFVAQELKSEQPELPARVAQVLLAAGWVDGVSTARGLDRSDVDGIQAKSTNGKPWTEDAPLHGKATIKRRWANDEQALEPSLAKQLKLAKGLCMKCIDCT